MLEHLLTRIRSKHVSVPMLALAIACRRPLTIQYAPRIEDLAWLFHVAKSIGDTVKWQVDLLHYTPRKLSRHEIIDITHLAGNLRQSILLTPLAMHVKEFIMLPPSGDLIGKRPIDEFSRVLKKFGLTMQSDQNCMRVIRKDIGDMGGTFQYTLQVTSTGVTFVAIAAAINAGCSVYKITNASQDPEVSEVLDSLGARYTQDDCFLKITGPIFNVDIADIPLDRIAIAELIIASVLHKVPNLTKSVLSEITLRNGTDFSQMLGSLNNHTQDSTQIISLNAEQFPGLSTDILPTLCTSLWLSRNQFEVIDNVFEWRMLKLSRVIMHIHPNSIKELQAGFTFNINDKLLKNNQQRHWKSDNIRQTSAGIIALTHPDGNVSRVVETGSGILRAYVSEWFEAIELITQVKLDIYNNSGACTILRQIDSRVTQ